MLGLKGSIGKSIVSDKSLIIEGIISIKGINGLARTDTSFPRGTFN